MSRMFCRCTSLLLLTLLPCPQIQTHRNAGAGEGKGSGEDRQEESTKKQQPRQPPLDRDTSGLNALFKIYCSSGSLMWF